MTPNFLVIGAAKSGTSSLDRYLSEHPQIFMPPKKEAHFFSVDDFPARFTGPGDDGMNIHTIRSWAQYQSLFNGAEEYPAVGESSVFYLYYPGTAERIARALPNVRVIILLRDPIYRAFSAYMHLIRDGRETLSFERSLRLEDYRRELHYEPMWLYKELGLYYQQVKRYMDALGRKRVKVVLFEDFTRNTVEVMQGIFKFLEVDPSVSVDTSQRINESGVPKSRWAYDFIANPRAIKELIKPLVPPTVRERFGLQLKSLMLRKETMDPIIRDELATYFSSDVEKLEVLLQQDLSMWKVHKKAPVRS
jgi:hypothetical protein